MQRAWLWLVGAVAVWGCGGAGSFDGKVAGQALNVKDSVLMLVRSQSGVGTQVVPEVARVWLADKPDLCEKLSKGQGLAGATVFQLDLVRRDDLQPVTVLPGAYNVVPSREAGTQAGQHAFASFYKTDADCHQTLDPLQTVAESGQARVENYNARAGGGASGSFELTFPGASRVKGTFNARLCDAVINEVTQCQ